MNAGAPVGSEEAPGQVAAPALLRYADVTLDPRTRQMTRGGRAVVLAYGESRLLALLLRRAGAAVTRAEIERALWGDRPIGRGATDRAVARLRARLDAHGEPRLLRTAYGVGYLLRTAPGGGR